MKRRKQKNDEDDENGFAAWGGYMAAKKSKLLEQFNNAVNNENNKASNMFTGISVFVNGYTSPTADEIKQIMALHGGIFHHYHIPSKTTYIIASNLPDTKIKQLGANQKIVKPEWISDSLQAGKLLDYTNYLLYSNHNRKQPKLNFEVVPKDIQTNDLIIKENNDEISLSPDIFGSNEEKNCNTVELNSTEISISNKVQPEKSSTRTLNANDPKFLSEFYNNSRLHHIATLGATFKQYICNLRDESNYIFPERTKFKEYVSKFNQDFNIISTEKSVIMHIDMDCFFVSVGLRNHPELKGVPIAVTHSKGGQEPSLRSGVDRQAELQCYQQRVQDKLKSKGLSDLGPGNMLMRLDGIENQSMSEIASCSYEARKAGVKNGMFMGTALKLCPNLKTIPYDFKGYKEVAYTLYNTIAEYTLNIEAVSCDEMFVDITNLLLDCNATVDQWATYIRSLIQNRTGCPCSTGFGANRLQARMATRTAKPNGQFHLLQEAVEEYMIDVKVDDLPGVGRSTTQKLDSLDVKTCGDLQLISIGKLKDEFGAKIGETLYNHCRGLDDRQLVYEHERKSVSAEVNYGIRFTNHLEAETFLKQVANEVHSRLTEIKMKGKCVTLKLMVRSKDAPQESSKFMGHGICDHITKSNTLSLATSDVDIITREVLSIWQKLSVQPSDLRGIGIQISRLEKQKKGNSRGALTNFFNNMNTTKPTENDPNKINKTTSPEKNSTVTTKMINDANSTITSKITDINLNVSKENCSVNKIDKGKSIVSNNQFNLTKRGRGRPRGRTTKTIERKNSNNGDLTKFLSTENAITTSVHDQIAFDQIDMEVFAALPEDIQNEILVQYKVQNTTIETIEINNSPKKESNQKITNDLQVNVNNSMFSGMDVNQIKKLIQDWVSSENTPELCDVKMLGEYCKQLALDKKINTLFMMLKFLYSEILFKNTCGWHQSYFKVVNCAQEGMLSKYGSTIWACKDFKCKNQCQSNKLF